MNEKRKYDSTVARMAGNILPALLTIEARPQFWGNSASHRHLAEIAVSLARAVVEEIERTEPQQEQA